MAKSETFTVPLDMVDDVLIIGTKGDCSASYKFKGVSVTDEGNGRIEMYGGNNAERAEFRSLADRVVRRVSQNTVSVEPATAAQISYLTILIQDEPGTAATIGASGNGSTVVAGLSKAQASRFIELMKSGV